MVDDGVVVAACVEGLTCLRVFRGVPRQSSNRLSGAAL